MKTSENKKFYNMDMLKIIATLMVISLHYLNGNMGGALSFIPHSNINYVIAKLINSFSGIAVDLFVLISGYFLIEKKSIKLSKIFMIVFELLFYCCLALVVVIAFNDELFSIGLIKNFISSILNFWYVYIYIIMYLLIPYINRLLQSLSQMDYKKLIIIFLLFFSIWPTFINNITVKDNGYGIINFLTLYMIGGYVKKYSGDTNSRFSFITFVLFSLLTFAFSFLSSRASYNNSIFKIIAAISLFYFFRNVKVTNPIYHNIAKHTLGIYIIHNNLLLNDIIFKKIFMCQNFYEHRLFFFHYFGTTLAIFLVCLVIDYLKQNTIDKFINKKLKNNSLFNYEFKLEKKRGIS